MKNIAGYRPWVARKAPLFNTTLNETYIKVWAIFPIVVISVLIGAAAAMASKKSIPSFNFIVSIKPVQAQAAKVAVSKPAPAPVIIEPVAAPVAAPVQELYTPLNLAETNTVMVPEIPMFNSFSVNNSNILETKKP